MQSMQNENAIENNTVENNVQNENIEDKNNENVNEENNNQTNTIQNTASNAGEEVTKTEIEKEETDKEKALNLVKKDWGEDVNVYFTVESIDGNGNYTIYVREEVAPTAASALELKNCPTIAASAIL